MTLSPLKSVRIGGAGNCCLDHLFVAPSITIGGFSPVRKYKMQCGGLTATALSTCARLGAETRFVSLLGQDEVADFIAGSLDACSVDTAHIHRVENVCSPVSFIHIEAGTGERTIYHRLDPALRFPSSGDLEALEKCDVLLVDDVYPELGRAAARFARSRGIPVIADTTPHDENLDFVAEVDILIAPGSIWGELDCDLDIDRVLRQYRDYGPSVVVLTLGKWGWAALHEEEYVRNNRFDVPVEDTTGAGDVFHGAFAFGWAQGWDLERCGCFASATAALKCTRLGAGLNIPTLAEVQGFLSERYHERQQEWQN